jgi:hypothetical protein
MQTLRLGHTVVVSGLWLLAACGNGATGGAGELVSAFTTVRKQGGDLKLLNLTKKVHDVLQITKLYTVFDVKDDEAGAIKSFNADAA